MEGKGKHFLTIDERKKLTLDGVQHVGSFDESEITLDTNMGFLQLKGEGMHITHLNLDEGNLVVEGYIHGIAYIEGRNAKGGKSRGKGIMNRLLK
ncbi:sporulation protein YabP [Desulforamulus ruminis]|uniref:Sporulation protein YabP n=1 Tax=Desulforamulus ruminis (strain ATCC 23193 / DSM 2154 / NCIMB 8452 / DL) TaxID=696281 RepID=F6DMT1_DESRL|nr:sporulation protein YabP [Desulforamulus ruminis]AEG58489.1 sporulation protein YabP [Desulforamulus ruminis DSM 2154]